LGCTASNSSNPDILRLSGGWGWYRSAARIDMIQNARKTASALDVLVDHATDLRLFAAPWNPPDPSHSDA
jgi:hypothetical protein